MHWQIDENPTGLKHLVTAMPRHRPTASGSAQLRRSIASAAARLMAEGGISDYGSAKRKAARQLGASGSDGLPSNDEIETELRAYQSIFQADEQHDRLRELRTTALEVMTLLEAFHPCLKGAVLDGTAMRYAPIELDLFADSSKDVEIFLLSNNISYSSTAIRRQNPLSAETQLHLNWNDDSVNLMIYPAAAERGQNADLRARKSALVNMLTEVDRTVWG